MKGFGPKWWVGHQQGRRPASRWRQALGLAVLLLLAAGYAGYRYVTAEVRLRGYAEQWLAKFSGGEVHIDRVELAPFGGLHLIGVTIATPDSARFFPPGTPLADRNLFTAGTLLLRLQPFSMITGDLVVPQIIAVNPKLTLVERDPGGLSNWEAMLANRKHSGKSGKGPPRFPEIRLRNVEVQQFRLNERGRVGGAIQTFYAGAKPFVGRPEVYDLHMTKLVNEAGAEAWTGEEGRLEIDMTTGAVSGSLPPLSLEELLLAAPPEMARWLDVLQLSGYVRAETFRFDPKGSTQASLRLQEAKLSVPIDEKEARDLSIGRYIQFSNLAGTIQFDGRQAVLDLQGLFRQSPIRLHGRMHLPADGVAGLAGVGLDLDLTASRVQLPRCDETTPMPEKRFVWRWHRLAAFVHDFDGRGEVDLAIRLHKEPGADKGIEFVEGKLTVRGASAAFEEFPYRLYDLGGDVQFRRDGEIDLVRLTGKHGKGEAIISGHLGGYTSRDSINLDIAGHDIELDRDLLDCMHQEDQALCRKFLQRASLGLEIHLERAAWNPAGPKAPWTTRIDANFLDGQFRYSEFPYPLAELRGRVRIAGGTMRLDELTGRHGPTVVRVSGTADRDGPRAGNIDVHLQAAGLELDDTFASALPAETAAVYAEYAPAGEAALTGHLYTEAPGGKLLFDLDARLARAGLALPGTTTRLTGLEGELHVVPDRLEIRKLQGQLGASSLSLDGAIGLTAADPGVAVHLRSESLDLGEALRTALPPRLRSVYDSLSPVGRVRLDLRYKGVTGGPASQPASGPAPGPADYTAVVEPLDCGITLERFPLPLEAVRGTVVLTPGCTRFEKIAARHGDTKLGITGRMVEDQGASRIEIDSLEATDIQFIPELRQALPWRLKRLWNDMQPTGACDLRLYGIRVWPAEQRNRWELNGSVDLKGMGLSAGSKFTDIGATLRGSIGFDEAFHADTQLDLRQGRVDGRMVTDTKAHIERPAGSTILGIREIVGRFYEGTILGDIEVDYAPRTPTFGLRLTARDVSLEGFMNATRPSDAKPIRAQGKMEGTLTLGGQFGRAETRQGSASVVIHEAQLARLPMILNIMRIGRMATDDDNAFQDALFDLVVDGDDVVLDRIDLRGKAISMVGAGRLQISSNAMHLILLVGSPLKLPRLAVLSELVEGVAREVMEVHVEGTLDSPLFRAEIARSIRNTVDAMTRVRVERSRLGAPKTRSPARASGQ